MQPHFLSQCWDLRYFVKTNEEDLSKSTTGKIAVQNLANDGLENKLLFRFSFILFFFSFFSFV
jgi:hypothetical protein